MGTVGPAHSRSSNISPPPFVCVDTTRRSSLEFHPQFDHRDLMSGFPSFLGAALTQEQRATEGPIPSGELLPPGGQRGCWPPSVQTQEASGLGLCLTWGGY